LNAFVIRGANDISLWSYFEHFTYDWYVFMLI
jgi:hypothetical protein